jgi:hypothetical protein
MRPAASIEDPNVYRSSGEPGSQQRAPDGMSDLAASSGSVVNSNKEMPYIALSKEA